MSEHWKDVAGYEGSYLVSDLGRIQSICTTFRNVKPGGFLKPTAQKSGYCIVRLWKNRESKNFYIHRLVARAFFGECPPKHEVNHKDGNRQNNPASNLEYVTRSENNFHAYRVLHRKAAPTYGVKHHNAKLSPEKAAEARVLFSEGKTYAAIGRSLGVHWSSIRSVIQGKTWIIK